MFLLIFLLINYTSVFPLKTILKDKSKNLKCRLLLFLFGALRVQGSSEVVFLISQ